MDGVPLCKFQELCLRIASDPATFRHGESWRPRNRHAPEGFAGSMHIALAALMIAAALSRSGAQPAKNMAASTFYIAASGEYGKYSKTLTLKGASNLPPRSRLTVHVYDFIGYRAALSVKTLSLPFLRAACLKSP